MRKVCTRNSACASDRQMIKQLRRSKLNYSSISVAANRTCFCVAFFHLLLSSHHHHQQHRSPNLLDVCGCFGFYKWQLWRGGTQSSAQLHLPKIYFVAKCAIHAWEWVTTIDIRWQFVYSNRTHQWITHITHARRTHTRAAHIKSKFDIFQLQLQSITSCVCVCVGFVQIVLSLSSSGIGCYSQKLVRSTLAVRCVCARAH